MAPLRSLRPEGLYYASVPTLGLVTHGPGIEEAMEAARDLVTLWLEEVRENGGSIPEGGTALLPSRTFRAILKQAGLSEEEFRKL